MFDKLLSNNPVTIISVDLETPLQPVFEAGYTLVEIPTTEPQHLQKIIQAWPQLTIGAGNILNAQELENAYQAGVHFATSPGFLPSIAQTANIYGMHYLPGINTITDAMQVLHLGYQYARVPSDLEFCKRLSQLIPFLKLIPGEVPRERVEAFLKLGNVLGVMRRA
jgi:2-dehydro-3-deoxyphosphogluconate aldolase / (4S)-4-hydroxy-2-oxoglutarate aldolase